MNALKNKQQASTAKLYTIWNGGMAQETISHGTRNVSELKWPNKNYNISL